MTDSPTPAEPGPVDPDAELASAHLDGEAGDDERARADDPEVQAHLAAFAAVADEVRDVPGPPPGLVDDQVARAMAAFDGEARVVPLGGTRSWWQRIPLGAVAAGLVVVALLGVIGLASTMETDGDDTATADLDAAGDSAESTDDAAPDEGADEAGSGGAAAEDSAAAESAESQEAFEAAGERIAYDSVDALAADLRAQLGDDPDAADAPVAESDPTTTQSDRGADDGDEGATDPCGAVSLLGLDPADVVLVRSVVLSPDEVTAVVHDAADGRRLTVVDDATCDVVVDRLL